MMDLTHCSVDGCPNRAEAWFRADDRDSRDVFGRCFKHAFTQHFWEIGPDYVYRKDTGNRYGIRKISYEEAIAWQVMDS